MSWIVLSTKVWTKPQVKTGRKLWSLNHSWLMCSWPLLPLSPNSQRIWMLKCKSLDQWSPHLRAIGCFLSSQQDCKYSGRDSLRKTREVYSLFWCSTYLRVTLPQLHLGSTWEEKEHRRFHQTEHAAWAWLYTERSELIKIVSITFPESLSWVIGGNHLWGETLDTSSLLGVFLGCLGPRRKMIVLYGDLP